MARQKRRTTPKQETEPKMASVMDQITDRVGGDDAPAVDEQDSGDVSFYNLRVPLEDIAVPTFRMHLDVNIQGEQATSLRRVASALDKNRATLANGRRCVGANDAIRWILEQISNIQKS